MTCGSEYTLLFPIIGMKIFTLFIWQISGSDGVVVMIFVGLVVKVVSIFLAQFLLVYYEHSYLAFLLFLSLKKFIKARLTQLLFSGWMIQRKNCIANIYNWRWTFRIELWRWNQWCKRWESISTNQYPPPANSNVCHRFY